MIWLIFILGSLLIGAAVTLVRWYDRIEQLERKLDASKYRSDGLVREVNYWAVMYDNYRDRYTVTVNALHNVTALGTDNMANIGQRMSKTAQDGIDAAKSIPFIKA